MYSLEIRKIVEKIFFKISRKDHKQLEIITKKVDEILENPNHYKNLRKPLQNLKRTRIDKSFVLTFSVNEKKKRVILEDYRHHDEIYKN